MIAATKNGAPSYTATQWIQGSPIAVDSDPNSVAPPASRIFTAPSYVFRALSAFATTGSGPVIYYAMGDGATISTRSWWYDDAQGLWVPFAGAGGLDFTTFAMGTGGASVVPGQRYFVQVTANSGCTKLAVVIR